jgi:hypothetical protein
LLRSGRQWPGVAAFTVKLRSCIMKTAGKHFDGHIPLGLNLLLAFRTRYSGRKSPHALRPKTQGRLRGTGRGERLAMGKANACGPRKSAAQQEAHSLTTPAGWTKGEMLR